MSQEVNVKVTGLDKLGDHTVVRLHINDETWHGDHHSSTRRHYIHTPLGHIVIELPDYVGRTEALFCINDRVVGRFPVKLADWFVEVPFLFDGHRIVLEYRYQ